MPESATDPSETGAGAVGWRAVGAALLALLVTVALLIEVFPGRLTPTAVRVTVTSPGAASR